MIFPFVRHLRCSRWLLAAALCASAARCVSGADTAPAFAGTYVSRRWITDDGLPHNVVNRIRQDRVGFLWLATLSGLTRFDGREFKVFLPSDHASGGGRNVRDLVLLEDGSVLFLPASGGVWRIAGHEVTRHPISRELEGRTLLELHAEPQGAIWVGMPEGVARWEQGRLEHFGREHGLDRRRGSFSWANDTSGRAWIAASGFLACYRDGKLLPAPEVKDVSRIAPARSGGLWVFGDGLMAWKDDQLVRVADLPWPPGTASARCMYEDGAGTLWLASSRAGLFRHRAGDGAFELVPDVETTVESIAEDREGSIWLATSGGGVQRLRPKAFSLFDVPATGIAEDEAGTIWLACGTTGLVRCVGAELQAFPYRVSRGPLIVSTVCADLRGNLWLGSPLGVFVAAINDPGRVRRMEPAMLNVRMTCRAQNGDVWVESAAGLGYFRDEVYTSVAGSLGERSEVTAAAQQPDGPLWFGTLRGELFAWSDGKLVRAEAIQRVGNAPIHAILPESSGVLWLATTEGLVRVEGDDVRRWTQSDGLPDDILLQLLRDDAGYFWFATPRGIFRIARAGLEAHAKDPQVSLDVVAFGPEQGLLGVSPTTNHQPATWRDRRGDLWFCTFKGAVCMHPSLVPQPGPPPSVLIDEIRVGQDRMDAVPGLRLPPGGRQLEFRVAALSFAAPEHVRVRHQLEGFDPDWLDTPSDRTVRYAKLPPGDYRLRVVAGASGGAWNHDGASLAFTVLPAWWQTAWFRGGVVIGFAVAVGGSVRFWAQRKLKARLERLEREHALEKERARIARDMHDELGGSVTGINLLVQRLREAGASSAEGVVDLLDRRVRRLTVELERVVWTVSPRNCSLERLASFAERFAHNLCSDSGVACRVRGRDSMPHVPITPDSQHHVLAVLKEAINNTLKHARAARIEIVMAYHDGVLSLRVSDDGVGFVPEAQEHSERNGLRNMHARLAELGGSLVIRSSPGTGTEVVLEAPLRVPGPGP